MSTMRTLVERLCGPECAGRQPGTKEGAAARAEVVLALRAAGLDPYEQPVPACRGANVLATIPGSEPGFVVVGAHFDHLGRSGGDVYWGADDNAAAVAILVEAARALAKERDGRGVIVAAFDGEEPPFFGSGAMGSEHFAAHARERVDLMVCMDLVGHAFGPGGVPGEVADSLFALGGERSAGTAAHLRGLARVEPGLVVRPVDADVIPPLSDYLPFWRRDVPFVFLSAGRSRVYHTPADTPDKLAWPKMEATARWLVRFVREARTRDPFAFEAGGRADRATLEEMDAVLAALEPVAPEAAFARAHVAGLAAACDARGHLPPDRRDAVAGLVEMLESRLA